MIRGSPVHMHRKQHYANICVRRHIRTEWQEKKKEKKTLKKTEKRSTIIFGIETK